MGVNIHPVTAGKAYQGDAVILSIGDGHAGWGRATDHDGYAVADHLGHYLARDPAA